VTKILYIEDNDDNVYMLKMRLELLGDFEVLAAENGEKGCEMAATEQPEIILMDLEMPVVDGWEATRRLRDNPQTRDIPIIALSAHALTSVARVEVYHEGPDRGSHVDHHRCRSASRASGQRGGAP
jgi:two-component system cell cycle response regulator DivK